MNFGYGFKGTLASYSLDANRRKPSGIKAAIIREKFVYFHCDKHGWQSGRSDLFLL